jgi:hypothetical protein
MNSFRVDIEIENLVHPGERRTVRSLLVDAGPAPAATLVAR